MENKPLRNLYLIVGMVVLLCCSFLILPPLFNALRSARDVEVTQKQLSCVALSLADLNTGLDFKNRGQTNDCNEYLTLNLNSLPKRCYQAMFSTTDKGTLLLNAVWEFSQVPLDEVSNAYNVLIAQKPENSFDLEIGLPDGAQIGEQSTRSRLTLERPSQIAQFVEANRAIYADTIYWRFGKWVIRLTSLQTQDVDKVDLIGLARIIQFRLEAGNVCIGE